MFLLPDKAVLIPGKLFLLLVFTIVFSVNAMSTTVSNTDDNFLNLSLSELAFTKVSVASSFESTRFDSASTISKVTRKEWEQWAPRTTSEILAFEPSVMVYDGLYGGQAYAIRGYGQSLSVRGVATLIDGFPVNDLTFGTAQYERDRSSPGVLESMEMVRGPSSVLYGTDAFHGVVALNTFTGHVNQTQINTNLSSEKYQNISLQHSSYLNELIRFDFAADISDQGDQARQHNYADSQSGKIIDDQRSREWDRQTLSLALHNSQNDDNYYRVGLYYNELETEEMAGVARIFPGLGRNITGSDNNFWMLNLKIHHKIDEQLKLEFSGFSWQMQRDNPTSSTFNALRVIHEAEKQGAKLALKYQSVDNSQRAVISLEHQRDEVTRFRREITTNSGVVIIEPPGPQEGLTREVDSVLLEGRSPLGLGSLIIDAGIRIDDYSDFGTQTTPQVSLIYPFSNRQTLKLLYGNAFRAAVSAELSGSGNVKGDPDIQPEEIDSWELVYQFFDDRWLFEMVAYSSKWQDGIVVQPLQPPEIIDGKEFRNEYINAGENSSQGVEFQLAYESGNWLNRGNISYNHSENDKTGVCFCIFPRWIINASSQYQINPRQSLALYIRAQIKANDGPESSNYDAKELPDYLRVDLAYNVKFSQQWNASLTIKNLFDRSNAMPSVYGVPGGIEHTPLTVFGRLQYNF